MRGLALCAGVGAMELGLSLALGRTYRTVCYVEREAYAAGVLVARMEDKALDQAPIWDDLTTFDGRPWRGVVDLVSSGLPCQPYSVAGKQLGHDDERALWPHFVRIVRECEPTFVFLENVPAFRKHFEPVWGELRAMGFEWAPPLLQTASESGAPHIRERFFALAAHPERVPLRIEQGRIGRSDRTGQAGPGDAGLVDPDSRESGLEGWGVSRRERADERPARSVGDANADFDRAGCAVEWCGWVFDVERQTLRHDTDRCGGRCRIAGTYWDSESPSIRVDARAAGFLDELRSIGNVGAPPVAYARAWRELYRRLMR